MNASTMFAQSLLLATWLAGAATLALATGGVQSPALILFLAGPMVGWGVGRPQLALEAFLFALLAMALLAVVDLAGWAPALSWSAVQMAWLGAGSGAVVALAGVSAVALRSADPEPSKREPEPARVPEAPETRAALDLPSDGVIAFVETSPLGMIKTVRGNAKLISGLKLGRRFQDALAPHTTVTLAGLLDAPKASALPLTDGRTLAVDVRPNVVGASVVLTELPKDSADAKRALAEQNAFYASLGHELKTPLNAILGFADMMREEMLGPMPEAYQDYPSLIHESGQDLLLLVEDLLDLSKAEANRHRLELEPVDLSASAEAVLRQMTPMATRKSVELKLASRNDVWAHADPRAVRQIWQNLVSNAIKYSHADGVVTLITQRRGDRVELAVTDTGEGMSEQDLQRIGRPFEQGRNAKGRAGTGLGLTVVKRFAELQGGVLAIETALGEGTSVTVTLPPARDEDLESIEDAAQ